MMLSRLSGRSVLSLSGPDSFTFLQGLVSNDLAHLNTTRYALLKGLFLGSDGRIYTDGFITRQPDHYTIETGTGNLECLMSLLKRRKLGSKVDYKVIEDCNVYGNVPNWLLNRLHPGESREKQSDAPHSSPEYTCDTSLLSRRYSLSGALPGVKDYSAAHRLYLSLNGFGLTLVNELRPLKLLPQDMRLHKMGFVANNKGCYVGQEIMNRLLNRTLMHKYNLRYVIRSDHLEEPTKGDISDVETNEIALSRVLAGSLGEDMALNILHRVLRHDVRELPQVEAEHHVVPVVYYSTGFGLALLPIRGPSMDRIIVDGKVHVCYPVLTGTEAVC